MKIFGVRLNADPRSGRPYSNYPTERQYRKIHKNAVGNGFHEAVNFLEESGKVRGYLPPRPSKELQDSEIFTLVSMTYKGDIHQPDKVFGIQHNCRFVGSTERVNPHIDNLDWHFICAAKDSILFPHGIPDAYAQLIGKRASDWFRGGPTKRLDDEAFLRFLENVKGSDLEPRRSRRFDELKSKIASSDSYFDAFDAKVAKAMKSNLDHVKGRKKPKKRLVSIVQYDRDPQVVAFALRRAGGRCEQCQSKAPFLRKKDQTPFLEVHHKITLANGGADTPENTQALCPNCHRKSHFG